MVIRAVTALFQSSEDRAFSRSLRNILGFSPGNLALYRKAFTHSSAANQARDRGEEKESYERLEFLGDAVLSAVIADFLFKKFPYKDEGFLTKMRSRIVSRHMLGKLAYKFGLDRMIDAENGVAGRSSSIYGDAFEAMIGATYLDKGYPFTAAFIRESIIKFHLDIDEIENLDTDYKSKLIEWAQKNKKELRFKLIEEKGTGTQKLFVVEANVDGAGVGQSENFSKKKAEQEAASIAIVSLGIT